MQLRSHTGCNYLLLLSTVFLFQGKWSPSKLPLLSPRLTAGKQMLGDDIYPSLLLQYIVFSKGDDDGNENADEVAMLCCNMGSAAAADGSIQMTTDNRDLPAFSHDDHEEGDGKEDCDDYDDDNIVTACCYIGGACLSIQQPGSVASTLIRHCGQ